MASLPVLLNLLDELDHVPQSFYNNDFGLGLRPHHLQQQPVSVLAGLPARSLLWGRGGPDGGRQMQRAAGRKVNHVGKDGFQVCMEVGQFKPSELQVKVVDGGIVVEGKHEEREDDHGYISRHFVRRYSLPKGYDPNQIASTLSSDGVLTVSIPKPPALENTQNERVVQIQQVGPAHLNVKENGQEKVSNGDNAEK